MSGGAQRYAFTFCILDCCSLRMVFRVILVNNPGLKVVGYLNFKADSDTVAIIVVHITVIF